MEELPRDLNRPADDDEINKALFAHYQHDASAFDAIYERFRSELFIFIEAHLEGALRSEAEDILQETFTAFHKMRDRMLPHTKLRGLLYRIAERRLTDAIRAATTGKRHPGKTVHSGGGSHLDVPPDRRATRDRTEGNFLADRLDGHRDDRADGLNPNYYGTGGWGIEQISDPKADPAVRDMKLEVAEMLTRLPQTEEEAVRLVELDGHTHASAAEVANVPESTIWSRVRSGRQRLKELATASLVLAVILGALANQFDVDDLDPICSSEADTDDDIIQDEPHGHSDFDRQYRKSTMRSLARPNAVGRMTTKNCVALDEQHPTICKMPGEQRRVYIVFRAGSRKATTGPSNVPRIRALQAA